MRVVHDRLRGILSGGKTTNAQVRAIPRRLLAKQGQHEEKEEEFARRFLFPWERGVLGRSDEPHKLSKVQKLYWLVLGVSIAALVGLKAHAKLVEEPRRAREAEEAKEKAVNAVTAKRALEQESFLNNTALEGLSPDEIQQKVQERAGDSNDPFEGMTPEEIQQLFEQQDADS